MLHFHLAGEDAIAGLLAEIIDEVRHDPYTDVPESDPREYDSIW